MERRAVIEFGNVLAWLEGTPKNVCAHFRRVGQLRGVLPAVALVCEDGECGIGAALGKSLVEGVGEVAEVVLVKTVAARVPEGERVAAPLRVSAASCNKSETIGERHQMGLLKEPRGVLVIRVIFAARVDGDRCIAVLASRWARSSAPACEPNDALSRARRTKRRPGTGTGRPCVRSAEREGRKGKTPQQTAHARIIARDGYRNISGVRRLQT